VRAQELERVEGGARCIRSLSCLGRLLLEGEIDGLVLGASCSGVSSSSFLFKGRLRDLTIDEIGGISFISRRHGWAIDNVLNYEVILANGTIAQISQSTAPDLYWALRGGGNNFGIVTNFDLATYPLTQAWGGYNFYLLSDMSSRLSTLNLPPPAPFTLTTKLLSLLGDLINDTACKLGYCTTISDWLNAYLSTLEKEQYDLDAQLIGALAYVPKFDIWTAFANNIHTKPTINPPVFSAFRKLPHVYTSNRLANFSTFHKELNDWNEGGFRFVPPLPTANVYNH